MNKIFLIFFIIIMIVFSSCSKIDSAISALINSTTTTTTTTTTASNINSEESLKKIQLASFISKIKEAINTASSIHNEIVSEAKNKKDAELKKILKDKGSIWIASYESARSLSGSIPYIDSQSEAVIRDYVNWVDFEIEFVNMCVRLADGKRVEKDEGNQLGEDRDKAYKLMFTDFDRFIESNKNELSQFDLQEYYQWRRGWKE